MTQVRANLLHITVLMLPKKVRLPFRIRPAASHFPRIVNRTLCLGHDDRPLILDGTFGLSCHVLHH